MSDVSPSDSTVRRPTPEIPTPDIVRFLGRVRLFASLDEDARILFDTTQVDGDGRSGHDLPVFSEGGSRSGHSRPDGWRELDNFAPTVVSQDTYVQYEDTTVSYQAL